MKKDYQHIFNSFAGKEVHVIEWQGYPVCGPRPHEKVTYAALDEEDPVVQDFKKAAAAEGLALVLWLPNSEGALMYREGRHKPTYLIGHVEKAKDGKWRIAPHFTAR